MSKVVETNHQEWFVKELVRGKVMEMASLGNYAAGNGHTKAVIFVLVVAKPVQAGS